MPATLVLDVTKKHFIVYHIMSMTELMSTHNQLTTSLYFSNLFVKHGLGKVIK